MKKMGTVLITGATDGIGLELASHLTDKFERILVHGRNAEKMEEKVNVLSDNKNHCRIESVLFDLSNIKEIEKGIKIITDNYTDLKFIINNAGIFLNEYKQTYDNLESMFMINHFSHFYLVKRILEQETINLDGIINTGSLAYLHVKFSKEELYQQWEHKFNSYKVYSTTKLYNLMHMYLLAEQLSSRGTKVYCYDPGFVNTKLAQAGWKLNDRHDMESAVEIVRAILEGRFPSGSYIGVDGIINEASDAKNCNYIKILNDYNNKLYERMRG